MIKLAHCLKKRRFVMLMIGLFALAIQLVNLQSASAMDDAQISSFEGCMEMPLDAEGADRDSQIDDINSCVSGTGLTYNEVFVLCSDDKYSDPTSIEKCNGALGKRVKTDPESNGEIQEGAVKAEDNKCSSNNRAVAWLGCPVVDSVSGTISAVYANIIEKWLVFKPEILTTSSGSLSDNGVYRVWSTIRGFANLVFIILILIMIFAHITGIQVQAYGFRRLLPKLIITVLLVNLSYYICQIVTDLSNIFGTGIGNLLISFAERVDMTSVKGFSSIGGGTSIFVSIIVVAAGLIVAYLAMGPAFLIPVLLTLIGALLTIFFVFVMLVVRQALMILMIIVSPVAIAFSALPNTETLFKKWFQLFKGLLITYPLASLLFYGGGFAARLILRVWDNSGLIVLIVAVGISIVPITMLPNLAKSSIAAIDGLMLRAQNGLQRLGGQAVKNNRYAERAEQIKRDKATRRAAGVYLDKKTGELKRVKIGKLDTAKFANFSHNLPDAMATVSRERHAQALRDNPDLFNQMQLDSQSKAAEMELEGRGQMSLDELSQTFSTAFDSGDAGMVNAAAKRLFAAGENGRQMLDSMMASKPVAVNDAIRQRSAYAAASAISSFGDEAMERNFDLANYAQGVLNDGSDSIGGYGQYTPPNSMFVNMSADKMNKMDTYALRKMHQRVSSMGSSRSTERKNVINSAARALQTTDPTKYSSEKRRIIDQIANLQQ